MNGPGLLQADGEATESAVPPRCETTRSSSLAKWQQTAASSSLVRPVLPPPPAPTGCGLTPALLRGYLLWMSISSGEGPFCT